MSKQNPRLDPARPLRPPEQAMPDNDEWRLAQYRRLEHKAASDGFRTDQTPGFEA